MLDFVQLISVLIRKQHFIDFNEFFIIFFSCNLTDIATGFNKNEMKKSWKLKEFHDDSKCNSNS